MSHLYPLAVGARSALDEPVLSARSKADATRLCPPGPHYVGGLETEWLTLSPDAFAELEGQADAGVSAGFVQRYENAEGASVLAVSYWKLVPTSGAGAEPDHPPATPPAPEADIQQNTEANPQPDTEADHTDDLYFRVGRTKPKRKSKKADPNQLDLFGQPKK